MIKIKLQTTSLHRTNTKEHYIYDKADDARLREAMNMDWENAVKLCIPKRKIGIRKTIKNPTGQRIKGKN